MKRIPIFAYASFATALCALSGCTTPEYKHLPRGQAANAQYPAELHPSDFKAFLIGPGDELVVRVVAEPDLSLDRVIVDNAGTIQMPVAGPVHVGGRTATEATADITQLLRTKGLREPMVALNISTAAPRTVSIEGQVNKAGVYPVTPNTTLLDAISLAESTNKVAKLDEVVVLRMKDGDRYAARFDLQRIRGGLDPDPQILPGDTVVVGFSQLKSGYQNILQASYLLSQIFNKL